MGKVLLISAYSKKLLQKKIQKRISRALEHHGFLTYLFGRFIPFGIRNVLSMTSGFVQFPFYKFAVFDSIAALFSISSLFWLTYFSVHREASLLKYLE
ncbi:VTT domain-containing protein [Treponema phagedenis]|nr:VTT domain-containing protein [Treponema phagedenis]